MQKYNLVVVTKTEVSGEQKEKFVTKIEAATKALEGKVIKVTDMGKKQLAYKMAGLAEASFTDFVLELPEKSVLQLGKKLTVDRDVIRHLMVKVED